MFFMSFFENFQNPLIDADRLEKCSLNIFFRTVEVFEK